MNIGNKLLRIRSLKHLENSNTYGDSVKLKVKVTLKQGMKAPLGKQRYSFTLSLTSATDGGMRSTPRPLYPLERDPVATAQEADLVPRPVCMSVENLASIWIRSPDRPDSNDSRYRLSYPACTGGKCTGGESISFLSTILIWNILP
jgi:hypothetical protein